MKYYLNLMLFTLAIFSYASLEIDPVNQEVSINSGVSQTIEANLINESNIFETYTVRIINLSTSDGITSTDPNFNTYFYLAQYEQKRFKVTFNKSVTSNTTITYNFRAIYTKPFSTSEYHKNFSIKVNYIVATCSLPAPINRFESNITTNSAELNWNTVSGANGYEINYNGIYNTNSTTNYKLLSGLIPGTSNSWRVRAKCSNGAYGNWSDIRTFTTPLGCRENIVINYATTANTEYKASGTITASAVINPNLNVKFRAEEIVLKPGFSVKGQSTGVFRAYIDPCVPGSQKMVSENQMEAEFFKKDTKLLPTLYPNPTSTFLNILEIQDLTEWKLIDMYGKAVSSGKINHQTQDKLTINTSMLTSGIYYFNGVLSNGELFQEKVIKK